VSNPEWLSKNAAGFTSLYTAAYACKKRTMKKPNSIMRLAAQYPLRSANDHVAALVHVANINIRNGNYEKATAYLQLAEKHKENITAKMKDVIKRVEQELKKH
jgi:hypothetical protein